MMFVKVRLGENDVSEKKFTFSKKSCFFEKDQLFHKKIDFFEKNRFSEFGEVSGPHFGIARFGWRFQP